MFRKGCLEIKKKNSRYLFIEKAIKKILFDWGWGQGSVVDHVLRPWTLHLTPASICFIEVKLALCNGNSNLLLLF